AQTRIFRKKVERAPLATVKLNRLRRFGWWHVFLYSLFLLSVRCPNLFFTFKQLSLLEAFCWFALDRRAPVSSLSSLPSRKFLNPDSAFRRGGAHQISMKTDHYDPITAALRADIGDGDITTDFFVPDTRKTTPGLRALEKGAVVAGGGVNHRFGLYDMVLVKDNHLATLRGLSSFADRIQQLRQERPNMRIEVEADDLEQTRAFAEI